MNLWWCLLLENLLLRLEFPNARHIFRVFYERFMNCWVVTWDSNTQFLESLPNQNPSQNDMLHHRIHLTCTGSSSNPPFFRPLKAFLEPFKPWKIKLQTIQLARSGHVRSAEDGGAKIQKIPLNSEQLFHAHQDEVHPLSSGKWTVTERIILRRSQQNSCSTCEKFTVFLRSLLSQDGGPRDAFFRTASDEFWSQHLPTKLLMNAFEDWSRWGPIRESTLRSHRFLLMVQKSKPVAHQLRLVGNFLTMDGFIIFLSDHFGFLFRHVWHWEETTIPAQYITRVYARTIEYKHGSQLRLGWDPHESWQQWHEVDAAGGTL